MKKVILITGSELRHEFFRKYVAHSKELAVIQTYCESNDRNLQQVVEEDENNPLRLKHLSVREQTEKDFFELFCQTVEDNSKPVFLTKGDINLEENVDRIISTNPDLLITFGSSIIKAPLVKAFGGRFINIHLGLSPYYRGGGTNFWPFVNGEPEYTGVTFMHIDEGVDTGEIVHQIRPLIIYRDNIHQIGNRLIKDMAKCCIELVINFDRLEKVSPVEFDTKHEKYYRKKDLTEESVKTMYKNFSDGLVDDYLSEYEKRTIAVPIINNPALKPK